MKHDTACATSCILKCYRNFHGQISGSDRVIMPCFLQHKHKIRLPGYKVNDLQDNHNESFTRLRCGYSGVFLLP